MNATGSQEGSDATIGAPRKGSVSESNRQAHSLWPITRMHHLMRESGRTIHLLFGKAEVSDIR